MKINNVLILLASIFISFSIFACNHTPEAKPQVVKPEDKVVSTLKSELEKINSALTSAKEIEIQEEFLTEGKVKEDKVADVKALYKDTMFRDIVIKKGFNKEDINELLDYSAKKIKKDLIFLASGHLLHLIDNDDYYEEVEKVKTLLIKEIPSIKDIVEEILLEKKIEEEQK